MLTSVILNKIGNHFATNGLLLGVTFLPSLLHFQAKLGLGMHLDVPDILPPDTRDQPEESKTRACGSQQCSE